MSYYNAKITDYGYKEKYQMYSQTIEYDNISTIGAVRRRYEEMSDRMKEKSDERRIRYYQKKVHDISEVALMNTDLKTFITLTFQNPVTNYDIAIEEWKLFIKRLQYYCSKQGISLKYIGTWEFQKNRGNVFHFHLLTNTGYVEHKLLQTLWGNGYVFISKVGTEYYRRKAISYTLKYCVKEVTERIKNKEDVRGQRFIFTSNNLAKPTVKKLLTQDTIEDVISQHTENIICKGQYNITDDKGQNTGTVQYVEYRK